MDATNEPSITEAMAHSGHEQVVFVAEPEVGLRAIIAVHSTALGPALGGVRFWRYPSEREALFDVLRLSEAMTLKAAMAGLPQGGGKAVVLWDEPGRPRTDDLRYALGRAIHQLGGRYLAAEDMGATQADMDGILRATPWVTGVDPARGGSGDPSPLTALGVLAGMRAACAAKFGASDLRDVHVAVQGAGHVGAHLVGMLVEAGARVVVSDADRDRARAVAEAHGARHLAADELLTSTCDVLAPCAIGGVLRVSNVRSLRCRVVCGAANNQLIDAAAGVALARVGILYAPDFVVNAGGIINIAHEWHLEGYSRARAAQHVARIEQTTARVLRDAANQGRPPEVVAEEMARSYIATQGAGRRFMPGDDAPQRALARRWERMR